MRAAIENTSASARLIRGLATSNEEYFISRVKSGKAVGNHEDAARVILQKINNERIGRFPIKVLSGLVEKKEGSGGGESAGDEQAPPFTSGDGPPTRSDERVESMGKGVQPVFKTDALE